MSCYIVRNILNKGRGMFAARSIKRGECIVFEYPLVRIGQDPIENLALVNALSGKKKKCFLALHNAFEEMAQEHGIIKTNAMPIDSDGYGGVYRIISRINHSCAPNALCSWSSITQMMYIYATEDIAIGSEILVSYLGGVSSREDRMTRLIQNFRFVCQCALCVKDHWGYDAAVIRIETINDIISLYERYLPKNAIKLVHEALGLSNKFNMRVETVFYYSAFRICAMYMNFELARKWAQLLLDTSRAERGVHGNDYQRYLKYVREPESYEFAGTVGYLDLSDEAS